MTSKEPHRCSINEQLIEQEFLPFGDRFLHYPNLIRGFLSLRTPSKRAMKGWPRRAISHELKCIFLDIVYRHNFSQKEYDMLHEDEQRYFDEVVKMAKVQSQSLARAVRSSDKERLEMTRQFNVMRGELLAGNDSKDLIKQMRNQLLIMKDKGYVSTPKFMSLMQDILSCI